ncbi:hypothetical protein [Tianweitania sediminis]|jgi:RNase P subunit RPR2|nr:hypothetical protein [Tianweitania sediminis]HEV7414819.1 hypothetical protein [Tianweitania sediminis]
MALRIGCKACKRTADYLASDIVRFQPAGRGLEALRMVCKECGAREITVSAFELPRKRENEVVIWRPTVM